jgi:DNA helicase II / ATP-dependent DNA helicase PcrA
MHGMWQSNIPSRFLDELPPEHVEVTESRGGFAGYGSYGASRFDEATHFGSNYGTPGWQRAQRRGSPGGFDEDAVDYDVPGQSDEDGASPSARRARSSPGRAGPARRVSPLTIEGELVAKSTGTVSLFGIGDRVFHIKFGNGKVTAVDGNKLTVQFDKAGEKHVVDSFLERA